MMLPREVSAETTENKIESSGMSWADKNPIVALNLDESEVKNKKNLIRTRATPLTMRAM
jgi:hypothetical protein